MAACGGSAAPGGDGEVQPRVGVQNVVVMRHGDRIDSFEPLWTVNAERPWDPPLTDDGRTRAWNSGKRLRASHLGFPIHRVVVSPFLRCLQTAGEVISALCAATDDDAALLAAETSRSIPTDPSRLKEIPSRRRRKRKRRPTPTCLSSEGSCT